MADRKRLDIIINHYKEPFSLVFPAIAMLKLQKNVDFSLFRVTLIHDGTEKFKELEEATFSFEFREVTIPHGGISAARNAGMDMANAEWITFCDCDDCFSSVYSLSMLMVALEDNKYDMLWNQFYRTINVEFTTIPEVRKELDWIWMADKYYRLDFLRERGIRFNEELEYAEDSAFNNWVRFEIGKDRVGEIRTPEPLYAWCRRKGSVTTSPENQVRNIQHVFKRNVYVSQLYEKYSPAVACLMIARTVTDGYCGLHRESMAGYPEERAKLEKNLLDFCHKNKEQLDKVPMSGWKYVLDASESNNDGNPYITEKPDFYKWYAEFTGGTHEEHAL